MPQLFAGLVADNPKLVEVAAAIAHEGDGAARVQAGSKLLSMAAGLESTDFLERHRSEVKAKSQSRGKILSDADLEIELQALQTERLTPVILAMAELGTDPIVDRALDQAGNKTVPIERRKLYVDLLKRDLRADDAARQARLAPLVADMDRIANAKTTAPDQVTDVQAVIVGIQADLRQCVDKALAKHQNLDVKGFLEIKPAQDGSVAEVRAVDITPPELAQCAEKSAKKARFAPTAPPAKPKTLRLPVNFKTIPGASP